MTKSEEKELKVLDDLIEWYKKNNPSVKRIAVTKKQYKLLDGKPYRGFEIYVPGERK